MDSEMLQSIVDELYASSVIKCNKEIDFFDTIARSRGWLPLEVNEEMRVHVNDKSYLVRRES